MSLLRSGTPFTSEADAGPAHAVETYRPSHVVPTTQMAFAHWTERLAAQPVLVAARELAGLSDENLSALAKEFELNPRRPRKDVGRFLMPAAAAAISLGIAGLLLTQAAVTSNWTWASATLLLAGFVACGVAAVWNLSIVPTDQAHGRLGLYVGELDEQHPWLYKALLLLKHPCAEAYRQHVLGDRGALRGVDYLLMEQIAAAHETLELTQTARAVRARIQAKA